MADLFFENQSIELQLGEGGQTRVIVAVVRQVSADHLVVEPVSQTAVGKRPADGTSADLFIVRPDALYSMPTEITKSETRPVLRLTLRRDDSQVNRIQRREYFRVNVRVRILYRWEGGYGDQAEAMDKTTYTRDMSAGGVLLQLPEEFKYNDRLWMEIYLPDQPAPLTSFGRVVRVRGQESAQGQIYVTGVEYVDMSEEARARITRFLFKAQAQAKL